MMFKRLKELLEMEEPRFIEAVPPVYLRSNPDYKRGSLLGRIEYLQLLIKIRDASHMNIDVAERIKRVCDSIEKDLLLKEGQAEGAGEIKIF